MFQDELLPGFDFLSPNELYDWSQQVFEGTDYNLFPNILITISIPRTGEQAGFLLTKENENFGVFFLIFLLKNGKRILNLKNLKTGWKT